VPLSLYLDDCSNSHLLAALLRKSGHLAIRPVDAGLAGEDDQVHLAFAVANSLTLVTKNPADFKILHDSDPNHFGILVVYQDNDPLRDMSEAEIVNAIKNLEAAVAAGGDPIHRHFHSLNDWRY
jgi:hypothetical protein